MSCSCSKLVLTGDSKVTRGFGERRNIPGSDGFNRGRVENDESFYIVYNRPDFSATPPSNNPSGSVVISKTNDVAIGFNVRSFQGFHTTGITVFEHQYYNGTGIPYTLSHPDVASAFPAMEDGGARSFIVSKEVWSLFTKKNFEGALLSYEGKTEFGPGNNIGVALGDGRIKSIKCIGLQPNICSHKSIMCEVVDCLDKLNMCFVVEIL